MKISMAVLLCFPLAVLAQKPEDQFFHRQNADSIVAFFLGKEIFQRYVKLEDVKSKNAVPKASLFRYRFRHPKFEGKEFDITLALDSAGQFVHAKDNYGIIRIESGTDSSWTSGSEALRMCRDQGRRVKRRSLRLAWDSTNVSYAAFQETKNFRDIVPGDLVWKIDGEAVFRGDRYSGTFEVNVFTGHVTRRFAIPWD